MARPTSSYESLVNRLSGRQVSLYRRAYCSQCQRRQRRRHHEIILSTVIIVANVGKVTVPHIRHGRTHQRFCSRNIVDQFVSSAAGLATYPISLPLPSTQIEVHWFNHEGAPSYDPAAPQLPHIDNAVGVTIEPAEMYAGMAPVRFRAAVRAQSVAQVMHCFMWRAAFLHVIMITTYHPLSLRNHVPRANACLRCRSRARLCVRLLDLHSNQTLALASTRASARQ